MTEPEELERRVLMWLNRKVRAAGAEGDAKRWRELQRRVLHGDPGARHDALTAMSDEETQPDNG